MAAGERGSAVVGFALVAVPVAVLLLTVLQAIAYLRLHATVAAAAAEGARWAAADGRSTRDGGAIAEQVLGRSPVAGRVHCAATEQPGTAGTVLVVVRCRGTAPAVLPPPDVPLHATARAVTEGR